MVKPPASLSKSKGAACGGGGSFVLVDRAVTGRWVAGPQPATSNRARASHGIPQQIAFRDRILLRIGMFHRSLVHRRRYRLRLVVRLAWRCAGARWRLRRLV